jgi:methyltransferase family protein
VSHPQERRWRKAAGQVPFIDRGLRTLRRTDEIETLQRELAQRDAVATAGIPAADDGVAPFLTWRPPGHYYSPVPDLKEIRRQADRVYRRPDHQLEGVDINEDAQLALFKTLAPLANDVSFNAEPQPGQRYFTNNPAYGAGDATILQAFLRHLRPKRYLEVGSGWTTALALDTNDQWLDSSMRVTCIEPYPDDLNRLLRATDDVEVIARPVQDVPVDRFRELGPDDVLFIDCSHVVKTGSDAHHLITRVLPVVPVGVYVHIHDIFWPFEYPKDWIEEGRAWSEAYLVHAFLMFNSSFEIVLFNDWLTLQHYDLMTNEVPALAPGMGGALWLRRLR